MTASVIITTYKRPVFLKKAVANVLAQAVPTEIIVGNTDRSIGFRDQEILDKLLEKEMFIAKHNQKI